MLSTICYVVSAENQFFPHTCGHLSIVAYLCWLSQRMVVLCHMCFTLSYIYIYIYMMCDCIWLFQSPHTQLRIGDNFCVMLRPDVITCGHILSLCIDSRNDWATRKEMWKNEQWPKLNPKSVIDQLQVWVQDLEPDIVCDSTNGTWSECRWMEMNP